MARSLFLVLATTVILAKEDSYDTKPSGDECCSLDCPKGQHCELKVNPCLIPPCPTSPQCIPDCPKGQIWITCPSCTETRTCVTLHLGLLCKEGCYPPQCICPDGKHLNDKGKCVTEEDCQSFPSKDAENPYK